MTSYIVSTHECPMCGYRHRVELTCSPEEAEERLRMWRQGGKLIQEVFPEFDPEQREILMTGMCNRAWDKFINEG